MTMDKYRGSLQVDIMALTVVKMLLSGSTQLYRASVLMVQIPGIFKKQVLST